MDLEESYILVGLVGKKCLKITYKGTIYSIKEANPTP